MPKLRAVLLVWMALWLAGCAGTQINKAAFAKPKRLAMVNVNVIVTGLGTSRKEDTKIAGDLANITFKELGSSRHVRLVPEKAVLSARAYKAIEDKGPPMLSVMAPGYKYFQPKDEAANLKALAKELKVDGFIFIRSAFGAKNSGMAVSGILPVPVPVSIGKEKAFISYWLHTVDPEGNNLWSDKSEINSPNGIVTVMGVGKFSSLINQFVDLMKEACNQLVATLEKEVAGGAGA